MMMAFHEMDQNSGNNYFVTGCFLRFAHSFLNILKYWVNLRRQEEMVCILFPEVIL